MSIGGFTSNNKYISKHNYLRFDSESKIIQQTDQDIIWVKQQMKQFRKQRINKYYIFKLLMITNKS